MGLERLGRSTFDEKRAPEWAAHYKAVIAAVREIQEGAAQLMHTFK